MVHTSESWEPKLAALEATVESITLNLGQLTASVQAITTALGELTRHSAAQFEQLAVGVAAVAGPRKTDWAVFVAAGILILAIGNGALSPLQQRMDMLQEEQHRAMQWHDKHAALSLHPVGKARIDALDLKVNAEEAHEHEQLMQITQELAAIQHTTDPDMATRITVLESRLNALDKR